MFNDPLLLMAGILLLVWGIACLFFREYVWQFWVWTNNVGNAKPEPMERTKAFDRIMSIYGIFSLVTVAALVVASL